MPAAPFFSDKSLFPFLATYSFAIGMKMQQRCPEVDCSVDRMLKLWLNDMKRTETQMKTLEGNDLTKQYNFKF